MHRSLPFLFLAVLGLNVTTTMAQEAVPTTHPAKAPAAGAEAAGSPAPAAPDATAPAGSVIRIVRPVRRIPFPERTPKPEATSEEHPRSFWDRLFGRRRRPQPPAEEPAAATPTPKPAPRVRKSKPAATPAPETGAAPSSTPAPKSSKVKASPAPKTDEASSPSEVTTTEKPAKPVAATATPVPKATPAPKTRGKTKETAATAASAARRTPVAPTAEADADAQEKYRYDVAKNKALEDAEVLKLKEKADGATSDDEARKAQRAYNKALFNKMRSIDSGIKDRADRIEASIMKRLDTAE